MNKNKTMVLTRKHEHIYKPSILQLVNRCMLSSWQTFNNLNKVMKITIITVIVHWSLLQTFSYYCTPTIRDDNIMNWLIDSGYSIITHPTTMVNPICAGSTYYMTKMSELFISTWYIAAMGILSQLWDFAGGGFEKMKGS